MTPERKRVDAYANRHTRTAYFTCTVCRFIRPQQGSKVRNLGALTGGLRRHICGECAERFPA